MAQSVGSPTLLDDLISSITGLSNKDAHFKALKSTASRSLRNQSHARTNQFEIHAKYEGLIEKFSILNRDDLAEALQLRWDELPERPSQTQPEILSLLLLLSDRPVEKTNLAVLVESHSQEKIAPSLTWQDIIEDDPFTDEDIWRDVDRGYHSSGDEEGSLDEHVESELTISTQATSIEDGTEALARLHVIQLDNESHSISEQYIKLLHKSQAAGESVEVSELFMIKETFSMFQGLPNSIYIYGEDGSVSANSGFTLTTTTTSTAINQLQRCASVGSSVWNLRKWCRTIHDFGYAYVHTCCSDVQNALNDFDGNLASLEHGLLEVNIDTVVSLIHVATSIFALAQPLEKLYNQVIKPSISSPSSGFYALMDELYDNTCRAQMAEDNQFFLLCAQILVNAVSVYLRSIATWVHSGRVEGTDDCNIVEEAASNDWSLGKMWVKRFQLKSDQSSDRALAPSFLQPLINQIFALGKSQAFIKELDGRRNSRTSLENAPHDTTTFVSWTQLKAELVEMPLLPFPELFSQHLSSWLNANANQASDSLKMRLIRQERVLDFPNVLGYVFHSSNGIEFQSFATALFRRLKRQHTSWHDNFLVTEMAQETLGSCEGVDAASISITVQARSDSHDVAVIERFEDITLTYAIAWPLQNITHEPSPAVDAGVFCLLLQTFYAKALLSQPLVAFKHIPTSSGGHKINQPALKLRYALLWFIEVLLAHIGSTTQISRRDLADNWAKADGIDSMAAYYTNYCNSLEMNLLLKRNLRPLKRAVIDILKLADSIVHLLGDPSADASVTNTLTSSFEKNLSFLSAGLRSISRAAGDGKLEIFAEKLEWKPA